MLGNTFEDKPYDPIAEATERVVENFRTGVRQTLEELARDFEIGSMPVRGGRSETSKCRARLAKYCEGMGVDVGFGGDLIVPRAMGVDLERMYCPPLGGDPQHIVVDSEKLPFEDGTLDFVFSSHLIEDFSYEEQCVVIDEWRRVLKPGGRMILYAPIEQVYRKRCEETGQTYNEAHVEKDFCWPRFCAEVLDASSGAWEVEHSASYPEEYSWECVLRKV